MRSSKGLTKSYHYHNPTAHLNRSAEVKIQLCKNRIRFLDHLINTYNKEIKELNSFIEQMRKSLERTKE